MIIIKIIFLDIDGVINPLTNVWYKKKHGLPTSSYYIKIPGDKIYRLKKIVMRTGAKVVIASKWRLGYDKITNEPSMAYQNAYNQLTAYGIEVIGYTPVHYDQHRGREIQEWLRYNPGVTSYVCIDDNISDIVELHRGHVIKTSEMLGLQDIHVNIAVNILNREGVYNG